MKSLRALALTLALGSSGAAIADTPLVVMSDQDYTRLELPAPFARIVFPPGTQLDGQPISLADGRVVLVRFKPEFSRRVTAHFELVDGRVLSVQLEQRKGVKPTVWRAPGLSDQVPRLSGRPDDKWIRDLFLSAIMQGQPASMDPIALPPAAQMGALRAHPEAAWAGSGYRMLRYRLQSDSLLSISPPDFYRDGVVAVLVETDVVSPSHSPVLLVLEEARDG